MADREKWELFINDLKDREDVPSVIIESFYSIWKQIMDECPDVLLPTVWSSGTDEHVDEMLTMTWNFPEFCLEIDIEREGFHWFFIDRETNICDGSDELALQLPPEFLRYLKEKMNDEEFKKSIRLGTY